MQWKLNLTNPRGHQTSFIISEIHYNQLHFHSRTLTGSHEFIHYMQKFTVRVFLIRSLQRNYTHSKEAAPLHWHAWHMSRYCMGQIIIMGQIPLNTPKLVQSNLFTKPLDTTSLSLQQHTCWELFYWSL